MMWQLFDLFIAFLKVGSFSFGGAYSLIPVIENQVVKNYNWLLPDEFLKILGLVQIFPGAISIKFATYTGYKIAGVPGVIAANLGNMLVPMASIIIAVFLYHKYQAHPLVSKAFDGIKFVIVGMIIAIMTQYFLSNYSDYRNVIFVLLGLFLVLAFKASPFVVIPLAAILALLIL